MKTLAQMKADHAKGVAELEAIQSRNAGKTWEAEDTKAFDKLVPEIKALQDEIDRTMVIEDVKQFSRIVDRTILPASNGGSGSEAKGREDPDEVVGYLSLGAAFTNSPGYKQFAEQGMPAGAQVIAQFDGTRFELKGRPVQSGLVPVTRKMIESKAIPTVGAGFVRTDRQGDMVRFAERDRLRIRDLLNVSPTTSNSVEYTTMTSSTRAAAPVAEGALKPEAALALGTATAPVRTLATWIPVTEQQLGDVPQLQNMIDVELLWDLGKVEEEQILWGAGTGQNLLGIFNTPGVTAGRTVGGDTIIDMARRAMTDIVIAGLEPNGIVMDPLDWETAQLTKETTNGYVWVVVTDNNGSRLWGLRVIETVAMREPGTFTTNERRMLVGDFVRGATLWDRQQAGVQVGWKNDDFIRNQRTLRAEERVAFGVKRPAAFKYRITAAHAA